MKKYIIYLFLVAGFFQVTAQKLSSKATVSVITCGPGEQLFTAFGHSAFRVKDPLNGIDKIYNYGTFDFNAPNFYLNFAKGNLIYQLSASSFDRFLRVYHYENRWVDTQILNLNQNQVQSIFNFLENNALPENKNYRYDFFYDNCSTKIEVVLKEVLKDEVIFSNNHIKTHKTQRDLIADYTKNFPWGKFGIDLALGAVIDRKASKDEYKFLPDYIFKAIENGKIRENDITTNLVKKQGSVLKERKSPSKPFFLSPMLVCSFLALLIVWFTYKNFKSSKRTKALDFVLFLITGIVGIVVLLLWFATTHTATYENFNFLWAFAPNAIVAFYLLKKNLPKWFEIYTIILLAALFILIGIWLLKIQIFNLALIPLLFALGIRYFYLFKLKN